MAVCHCASVYVLVFCYCRALSSSSFLHHSPFIHFIFFPFSSPRVLSRANWMQCIYCCCDLCGNWRFIHITRSHHQCHLYCLLNRQNVPLPLFFLAVFIDMLFDRLSHICSVGKLWFLCRHMFSLRHTPCQREDETRVEKRTRNQNRKERKKHKGMSKQLKKKKKKQMDRKLLPWRNRAFRACIAFVHHKAKQSVSTYPKTINGLHKKTRKKRNKTNKR